MKRKLIPLIGIAFVVALISTAAFYSLFAARMRATPTADPRLGLVTAARPLAPGAVLKPEDLSLLPWSGAVAPPGAFTSPEQVAGQTAAETIPKGELILASRLVSREGASSHIPEGMRAVSIHVSDSAGVVSMLKPGHRVDLQVFGSRSPEERQRGVRTLLRGVPVLAVNQNPEPSSQGYFSAPVITVLASAAEAEQLAYADSFLRLRIALRNPGEQPQVEPSPSSVSPRSSLQTKLVVRTFGLPEAKWAAVANHLERGIRVEPLTIASPENTDVPGLLARHEAVLESERTVLVGAARTSYLDLPAGGGGKVRVGIRVGSQPARLRVRPEISLTNGGRPETRSLETEVRIGQRRYVVISGFGTPRIVVISASEKV